MRVIGWMLVAAVLIAAGMAGYNLWQVLDTAQKNPLPGAMYSVSGKRMHLYCSGQGSPTVVFENGWGTDWTYDQRVQPEVAKFTRVCSYDRAGIGWSEPRGGPRDAKTIEAQLHTLLQTAKVEAPYVLVGASAGGFYVREFASDYPSEVAGIVFVDASTPEQLDRLPNGRETEERRTKRHKDAERDWWKSATGWARLRGQCVGENPSRLPEMAGYARASACRPEYETSWLGEADDFWWSGAEAALAKCCEQWPVLVISRDPDKVDAGNDTQTLSIWDGLQENLKSLSPHSRRVVAKGSAHAVLRDRPDVVIEGVRRMITSIRSGQADADEGKTVVQ